MAGADGRTRRDVSVAVQSRHGRRSAGPARRLVGQLPAVPAPQQLPADRPWVSWWTHFVKWQNQRHQQGKVLDLSVTLREITHTARGIQISWVFPQKTQPSELVSPPSWPSEPARIGSDRGREEPGCIRAASGPQLWQCNGTELIHAGREMPVIKLSSSKAVCSARHLKLRARWRSSNSSASRSSICFYPEHTTCFFFSLSLSLLTCLCFNTIGTIVPVRLNSYCFIYLVEIQHGRFSVICAADKLSVKHSSVCNFLLSVITAPLCQFLWAPTQQVCVCSSQIVLHTHTHTHTHTHSLCPFRCVLGMVGIERCKLKNPKRLFLCVSRCSHLPAQRKAHCVVSGATKFLTSFNRKRFASAASERDLTRCTRNWIVAATN